jgi:hypothetical protein
VYNFIDLSRSVTAKLIKIWLFIFLGFFGDELKLPKVSVPAVKGVVG